MRRLAWIALAAFGLVLAAVASPRAGAQQAPLNAGSKFVPELGAALRDLTEQSVKVLGQSQPHALLVVLPFPGGPADRAGLHPADVILELESAPVGLRQDFTLALQRLRAGHVATLGLLRANERLSVRVTLARAADIRRNDDGTERLIEAHEAILRIFKRETFPQDWALTQRDFGDAYRSRNRDDADNLEQAIAAYQQALTVVTREVLPQDWADTQSNLIAGSCVDRRRAVARESQQPVRPARLGATA
jgi:hypothetical protein